MSWYCIELSPEQVEFGFADIIRAELEEIFISRGAQEYFMVWKQQNEGGTRLFLSPVAAESAQLLVFRFGGTRCDEPEKTKLDFLLGYAFRDDI